MNLEMVQFRWVQGWHINVSGNLSSGQLLSWIDEDAMMLATLIANNKTANFITAGMERVSFHQPVFQGDRLRFHHRVVHAGQTSLWTYSEVFSEDDEARVFSSYSCLVGVDTGGKPKLLKLFINDTMLGSIPRNENWHFVELLRDLYRKDKV